MVHYLNNKPCFINGSEGKSYSSPTFEKHGNVSETFLFIKRTQIRMTTCQLLRSNGLTCGSLRSHSRQIGKKNEMKSRFHL